jgi:uncharacterized membrane protein
MATLVAIGYPEQATAQEVRAAVERLQADLVIDADQVAAMSRGPGARITSTPRTAPR